MRNIPRDRRVACNHHAFTDAAELVHRGTSAQEGMLAHAHVTRQQCRVGEDDVVRDFTIMRNMARGHQKTVRTDRGEFSRVEWND